LDAGGRARLECSFVRRRQHSAAELDLRFASQHLPVDDPVLTDIYRSALRKTLSTHWICICHAGGLQGTKLPVQDANLRPFFSFAEAALHEQPPDRIRRNRHVQIRGRRGYVGVTDGIPHFSQ